MADKVKLVSNTKIFLDITALFDEMIEITPNFPRMFRFSIGQEMQQLCIALIKCITHAYIIHDRAERIRHLENFQSDFETLKLLIRKAGEKQWIKGRRRHAHIIELMDGIGKQCSAWKNSLIKNERKPESER